MKSQNYVALILHLLGWVLVGAFICIVFMMSTDAFALAAAPLLAVVDVKVYVDQLGEVIVTPRQANSILEKGSINYKPDHFSTWVPVGDRDKVQRFIPEVTFEFLAELKGEQE